MSPARAHTPGAAKGIACVIFGITCLTIADAHAKWLGEFYSPLQLMFLRALIALPLVAGAVAAIGGKAALRTQYPVVHLLRGALNILSGSLFYLGLTLLPLAENTAIAFAAPLFVVALSGPLLRESVDRARWLGALAGFAGVLVVVRPGAASFQAAALLPLGCALGYALMMLTARKIGRSESMLTTMLHIVLAQVIVGALAQPWVWTPPQSAHLLGLFGLAVFSTLGLTFITQGFRIGPAAVVAPFDYTGLLWATLLGWYFWHEIPDAWTVIGALIIVGSGIFIALREARYGKPR